jgi:hypothetical protein
MQPIDFEGSNSVLDAPPGMENCSELVVYRNGEFCLSCWRPSLRELLWLLVTRKIWLWVCFGMTQPPVAIESRLKPPVKPARTPQSKWTRVRRWWRRRQGLLSSGVS